MLSSAAGGSHAGAADTQAPARFCRPADHLPQLPRPSRDATYTLHLLLEAGQAEHCIAVWFWPTRLHF